MQFSLKQFFIAFYLLQTLKAQDSSPLEQDKLVEVNSEVNNVESILAEDYVNEIIAITGCEEDCIGVEEKNCQCNCTELCDQPTTTESTLESITETVTDNEDKITTIQDRNDENSSNSSSTQSNNEDENNTTNLQDNVEVTTATSTAADIEQTTATNDESTEITTTLNCTSTGYFPHPSDCHRYYNCNRINDVDDTLEASEHLCPTGLAFNTDFSNCMRDLSPCSLEHGGFECSQAGSFSDPNNETNIYYRCVPHLDGKIGAYHKYIIKCGTGKIYMPQLGKCFVDINSLSSYPLFDFNPLELSDEQLVKIELKQWKIKEKAKLKEEKLKLKYEEKLQKELAKKQAKEAKEKAKAEKKQEKELGIINDDYE